MKTKGLSISTNKVLLFGLSADMPHRGHIEWISHLKELFSDYSIVVMPCNANPLGKKDGNGDTIYPTNGYLRWQMLYAYYQVNDPEIIISQYEITINTPSTTIETLRYLKNTSIEHIKKQRGYELPPKIATYDQNNIIIAIGSELFNELPLWHDWQEILTLANIVIMNRAGYKELQTEEIQNQELKTAFINGLQKGSITQVKGPQINISSRELKKMLRNGASDAELLKYIPQEILSFIRENIADFSVAYYQNKQAIQLYNIAIQLYQTDLQQFDSQRNFELSAYIADLVNVKNIDKWNSNGYKLENGRLTVNVKTANHISIHNIIANWMNKKSNLWFKNNAPYHTIIPPRQFFANFKILGNYGPNYAVDIIMFVQDNNQNLKILTIKRNDDKQTPAIPGGFFQDEVLNTAIFELLEECFSNNLFIENSKTSALLNDAYPRQFKLKLNRFLTKFNFHNLINYTAELPDDSKPSEFMLKIISKLPKNSKLTLNFKCKAYAHFLPKQFATYKKFIEQNGVIGPNELSATDERNTNLAWIVTRTMRFFIQETKFTKLLEECGLELSGGDDAASAHLMLINDFCTSNIQPFALHNFLVIRDLAKFAEEGKIINYKFTTGLHSL